MLGGSESTGEEVSEFDRDGKFGSDREDASSFGRDGVAGSDREEASGSGREEAPGFGRGEAPGLGRDETTGFDREELSKILDALPSDGWIVDEVLSSSPFETTQIVHRDKGMVAGKFVRKIFTRETGLGAAYQRILAAQIAGFRFEHLPFVYDVVEVDEGISAITQLVQGETLNQVVESGARGTALAVDVGRQLCDAMTELHESFASPVVHRDLKPSNIVIADGKLVLIDLGIARAWRVDGIRDTVQLGTPGYAPPEQFGYGQTTPQSDIYAAGMVMAFCFTGENPTPALRESQFDDPRIPGAFREVLVAATALDAAQRYPSARSMKAAIDRVNAELATARRSSETDCAGGAPSHRGPAHSVSVYSAPAGSASAHGAPTGSASPHGAPAGGVFAGDIRTGGASAGSASAGSASAGGASASSAFAGRTPVKRKIGFQIPKMVGVIWNVVLALFWVLLTALSIVTAVGARTEFLAALPLWFRLFEYLAMIIVPTAAIGIVLADKRRLRERFPILGRWSLPKMIIACIVLIVLLYAVTITIHYALFG